MGESQSIDIPNMGNAVAKLSRSGEKGHSEFPTHPIPPNSLNLTDEQIMEIFGEDTTTPEIRHNLSRLITAFSLGADHARTGQYSRYATGGGINASRIVIEDKPDPDFKARFEPKSGRLVLGKLFLLELAKGNIEEERSFYSLNNPKEETFYGSALLFMQRAGFEEEHHYLHFLKNGQKQRVELKEVPLVEYDAQDHEFEQLEDSIKYLRYLQEHKIVSVSEKTFKILETRIANAENFRNPTLLAA